MSAAAPAVAAASAVCSAAGVAPLSTFICRSQATVVALYAGAAKTAKVEASLASGAAKADYLLQHTTYKAAAAAAAAA